MSAGNGGMRLCLALSYGGRQEIVDAMRALAAAGVPPEEITEEMIDGRLYQPHMPPVDLMIRTARAMRLSNFLLWQLSYAELYVSKVCWPDFREEELGRALESYGRRTRKFGGLVPER